MSLPPALAEIVDDFAALGDSDKVTLLLEFAGELPELPAELAVEAMEPVPECQSPVFLSVDAADPDAVRLYFSAPPEAPTTRGFASILSQGLDGASAAAILEVPGDFYHDLGLASAVSPLRLRGMAGMLGRIKAAVRTQTGSAQPG
jgi:cysteine desulfuration protein SufE